MTDDSFELPVSYKGKQLSLPAKLISGRYAYKIQVQIEDILWNFERDDQGAWRAQMSEEGLSKNHHTNNDLLQAIAESIEQIIS